MIRGVILDLDGTVYLGGREVPGAARFVTGLQDRGIQRLFVTNRANRPPEPIVTQLRGFGIPCETKDILTSAQATARYLGKGAAYCVGEEGLTQALEEQGLTITEDSPDVVVVGFDRAFTYEKLEKACQFIGDGARFVATNPDKALRVEDRLLPGTGAIVAAIAAGSATEPLIIGKPERTIIDMAIDRLALPREDVIMVGDNVETDVPAAHGAGVRVALILSGISTREDADRSPLKPTWIVENYDELTTIVEGETA
jgi:4-nitrophenyl phosphatase